MLGIENKLKQSPTYWRPVLCIAGIHRATIVITICVLILGQAVESHAILNVGKALWFVLRIPFFLLNPIANAWPDTPKWMWRVLMGACVILNAAVIGVPVYLIRNKRVKATQPKEA